MSSPADQSPASPPSLTSSGLMESLSPQARTVPESGIVEVMNYGRNRPGLIPLWAGEGDLKTPDFITEAACRSLQAGETFYTWQRGIPELREALAAYHRMLFGQPFEAERFYVTGSGMQAIQIAINATVAPGEAVIVPTPAWPNFAAGADIRGAQVLELPMALTDAGWHFDLDALEALAARPEARALFFNAPCNPTGWVADRDTMRAILDIARRHGLWIVADEVYGRFVYGEAPLAPSFHDIASPEDRILFVNTFSKNWAMTGWRIGWIEAPPAIGQVLENLIQYSTSGVATFMQRAAVAALEQGEDFVALQVARSKESRDVLCDILAETGRVRFARPEGAFYLFFGIDGHPDVARLGLRLVDEAGIGLAPGTAFGAAGAGYMRLCFARPPAAIREAATRLADWIARH